MASPSTAPSAGVAGKPRRARVWRWLAVFGILLGVGSVVAYQTSAGRPARAARHMARAEDYRLHGDLSHARVELRTAWEIVPADGHVRYLLGRVEEEASNFPEALEHYGAALGANPRDEEARTALARLLMFSGRSDEALTTVGKGLLLTPNAPHLLALNAEIHLRRDEPEAARNDVDRAVSLAPTDPYVASIAASILQQSGDGAGALATLGTAIAAHPRDADLRAIDADLLEFAGRREDALQQVQEMVRLQRDSLPFRKRLARLLLLMDRPTDAEQTLRRAAADIATDEARTELLRFLLERQGEAAASSEARALVASGSLDDAAKVALGRFLLDVGLADEAERIFKAVVAAHPDRVTTVPALTALAGLRLAAGQRGEASALAEQVLDRDPRNTEALLVRARLALTNGDPQAAISDLRTVLRATPDSVPALRELVQAHAATGDMALAEEAVRHALDTSPADGALRLMLAQLLLNDRRPAEAMAVLRKLASDAPRQIEVQEGIYQAAVALRRLDEARAAALTEQQIVPDQPLGYYRLGLLALEEGKTADAEADLLQALARSNGKGEPLVALIRLYAQSARAAKALTLVDAALAKTPSDPELHVFRGDILVGTPALGDALVEYRRAIELAPAWAAGYRSLAAGQLGRKDGEGALNTLKAGAAHVRGTGTDGLYADLAGLSESLGRHEEAIAAYEQALKAAPNNPAYQNNLALLLVTYREDADSLRRADALVDKLSGMTAPALLDTRGWVKFKVGSSAAATSILQQASDALPNEPSIRYHLAVVQHSLGDNGNARANLTAALAAGHPFAERAAADALQRELKPTARRR